jgi:hypothetical protein
MAHSFIGGSTAARILGCPGSLTLHRKLLDPSAKDEASEYAREGSMLHTVMEQCLGSPSFDHLIGTEPGGFGVVLTQEHIDSKIIPAIFAFSEYVSTLDDMMSFEQEIKVSAPSIHKTAFGTADILGRTQKKLVVGDWKFGDGIRVDVEDNEQMLFYAACALETPAVHDLTAGIEEVDLLIIQPMRDSGEVWDVHTVALSDVHAFAARMREAVLEADKPEPKMALGDHCRWCKVKMHCELQRRGITEIDRTQVSPETMGELLTRAKQVEAFIESLREEAFKLATAGHAIPGWKIVPKRGQRKWLDEQVATVKLRELGLKAKEIQPPEILSPAQAEKLLKSKGKPSKIIDTLTSSVSSGNTLAPASDPRPAIPNLAALGKLVEGR